MDAPQNLCVTMRNGQLWFKIGDHDLSTLPILERGPIIECLSPGVDHGAYVAWVPVLFEGEVYDPLNMCRTVHEGEAETLIEGRQITVNIDARGVAEPAFELTWRNLQHMLSEGIGKRKDGGEYADE